MHRLFTLLILLLMPLLAPAQHPGSLLECNKMKYTKERPLIYEDAQDLRPYSFLNDDGEPDGYNVELIRMMLDSIGIPYEIRMKPRLMAVKDLREGRSDLMIGVAADSPEDSVHCSKTPVMLITQMSNGEESELKCKFLSGDEQLILLIDSVFTEMNANEETVQLERKWFYPEWQESRKYWPRWAKGGAVLLAAVVLFLLVYIIVYQLRARRITRENNRHAKRLAQTVGASGMRIWTYDVPTKTFAWRDDHGKAAFSYAAEEFFQRYPPNDAGQLMQAIAQLAKQHGSDSNGELTLNLKARDNEAGDNTLHDFNVSLSVLQRDKNGRPVMLIGTKVDVTEKIYEQKLAIERTMRFNAIFNTPLISVLYFNADGILVDLNDKACEVMKCLREDILADKVKLKQLFDTGDMTPEQMDGYHATLFVDLNSLVPGQRNVPPKNSKQVLCDEFTLSTVYDDSHNVIGIFAVCRNVSHIRESVLQQEEYERYIGELKQQLAGHRHDIDNVLHERDARLAVYSTSTHSLQIFRTADEVQHTLSQTRCMYLADDSSQKLVMRTLAMMDQKADHDIVADVQTKLRVKDGQPLAVQFRLKPQKDKKGNITAYMGLCRNFRSILQVCTVIFAFCCLTATRAWATVWSDKYNEEHPLVIVGDWNKPPYEFLNDDGRPAGMDIDLMRMLCSQFDIPCKFVLKEWSLALKTFERGDADIILANVKRYEHSGFAITENVVNYNRIRVAASSKDSIHSVTTNRLLNEGVVLKPGDYTGIILRSLDSLQAERIEFQSPEAALHGLLTDDYQFFCWDEEALKWTIREQHLEGITLCDVDIPISEIHIVGHDKELINQLDDTYSRMRQDGEVQRINDRWLHPVIVRERQMPRIIIEGLIAILFAALLYLLARLANNRFRRAAQTSVELNGMMQKAQDMGHFNIEVNAKTIYELERKYERLANTPFIAMSFYNREGWLIDINDKMKEICGITPDNPDVQRFWMTVNLFDIPLFRNVYKPGSTEGIQACMHIKYSNLDIDRSVEYHVLPLFDGEGQVANYFVTTVDLTYERNMLKRLMNLRHEQQDTQQQIELKKQLLTFLLQSSAEAPTS